MPNYDSDFYANQSSGSLGSARRILPLVFDLLQPQSVVDIGCGVGTWLRAAMDLGVRDCLGIDGEWVDDAQLLIPRDQFHSHDLSRMVSLDRRYELAISIEVAEHLPPPAGERLIDALCDAGEAVLFSAAIPQQGGTGHVNEQWQDYWIERFQERGLVWLDCLRSRVWNDPTVCYWHAQNVGLFVKQEAIDRSTELQRAQLETANSIPNLVHPKHYVTLVETAAQWSDTSNHGLKSVLKAAPSIMASAARRRLLGSSSGN